MDSQDRKYDIPIKMSYFLIFAGLVHIPLGYLVFQLYLKREAWDYFIATFTYEPTMLIIWTIIALSVDMLYLFFGLVLVLHKQ